MMALREGRMAVAGRIHVASRVLLMRRGLHAKELFHETLGETMARAAAAAVVLAWVGVGLRLRTIQWLLLFRWVLGAAGGGYRDRFGVLVLGER